MMKDKPYFAVIYMFVITASFSSVLIGFSRLTRDRVESNQRLELEKAVLEAFPEIQFSNNAEAHRIFTEQFVDKTETTGAYFYYRNKQLAGYAVPVEGKGFWDSIKGVVGIDLDRTTVTGISFYEQSETPGLGARIVEEDFRKQYIGKKIAEDGVPLEIKPYGSELGDNEVEAITGATQTCIRLEKLVNDGLNAWLDAAKKQQEATK